MSTVRFFRGYCNSYYVTGNVQLFRCPPNVEYKANYQSHALQALDPSIEEYVHNLRLPSKATELRVAHMYSQQL